MATFFINGLIITIATSVMAAGQLMTWKVAGTLLALSLASGVMKQARVVLPTGSCHKAGKAGIRGRRWRMLP